MNCIEKKTKQIMWLNGAAGSGKSAIGRSIVERCLVLGIPISRFFFSRTDPNRNGLSPVVATLAHQLMDQLPDLKSINYTKNRGRCPYLPQISRDTIRDTHIWPTPRASKESSTEPKTVVLLVDGVDECNGHSEQAKLIRTIANFISKRTFPMIAFFGSRTENHLCAEFRSPVLSDTLLQLPLDTDYRSDKDILLFLNDSFENIKSTHPFGECGQHRRISTSS